MYTFREKKLKFKKKNNYVKDLWEYGSILTIQKSLIKVWLWFLREDFHLKAYYLLLHHILSPYRWFGIKFNINFFIFYHSNLSTLGFMFVVNFNQYSIWSMTSKVLSTHLAKIIVWFLLVISNYSPNPLFFECCFEFIGWKLECMWCLKR